MGGPRTCRGVQDARLPVSAQVLWKEESETRVKLPPLLVRGQGPDGECQGTRSRPGERLGVRRPRTGRHRTVSRKRQAALLAQHKGCLRTVSTQDSHELVRGRGDAHPLCLLTTPRRAPTPGHPGSQSPGPEAGAASTWMGVHLAQAGCQPREKAALKGLRRCPGLCPHVLPKPCLVVPWGEGKAQSPRSPLPSESDIPSWNRKV